MEHTSVAMMLSNCFKKDYSSSEQNREFSLRPALFTSLLSVVVQGESLRARRILNATAVASSTFETACLTAVGYGKSLFSTVYELV